ncbi:MAG: alpha/beta fold hydrolase [Acidimicrobiales bacterium]
MPASVMPGAEPFSREGGPRGVLVLHGFTGNPHSMRPLAEALADAGFTVELPLLPGHGTQVEDMVPTRWSDYAEAAEAAFGGLERRCAQVALVGLSMGGTLCCWLAESHPEVIGVAVVNPFIDPPAESFRDSLRGLLDSGSELVPGVGSDIAKEGVVELAYEHMPVAAALSFFEGVDEVAGQLAKISCPVLLLSSRQDHVVPLSSGDLLAASVSGPIERVWLERSYHVATLDHDAPEVEALIVAFVRKVFEPNPFEPNSFEPNPGDGGEKSS